MSRIDANMSGYLHTYEAYRIPKGTKVKDAASKKYAKDQAKVMSVFRAMAKGDIVPASDEKKLMEYSSELYQSAKMAQSLALQVERRKHKSQWDEKEEEAHKAKMKELCDESNEAALDVGTSSREFSNVQKERIVEIDSDGVDFSSMQVTSLGADVTGAYINLSV